MDPLWPLRHRLGLIALSRPPRTWLVFETDFTSSANWDMSANAFISHAQNPEFAPPTGGTIDTTAGIMTLDTTQSSFTRGGSAVLNITAPGVLGSSVTVGEDNFVIYARLNLFDNGSIVFAFGNAESMSAEPVPAEVKIISSMLRRSSALASVGLKRDFNNPSDNPPPSAQNVSLPNYMTQAGNFFDAAFHYNVDRLTIHVKDTTSSTWTQLVSVDFSEVPEFESSSLVIYRPANGGSQITDLAISVPMAEPPEVFLALPLIDETGVSISVETETGFLYQLQRTTNLLDPLGWQDIGLPLSGTGSPVALVDTDPEDLSIYRVVLLDGTP